MTSSSPKTRRVDQDEQAVRAVTLVDFTRIPWTEVQAFVRLIFVLFPTKEAAPLIDESGKKTVTRTAMARRLALCGFTEAERKKFDNQHRFGEGYQVARDALHEAFVQLQGEQSGTQSAA